MDNGIKPKAEVAGNIVGALIFILFICLIVWGVTYTVIGGKEERRANRAIKAEAIELVSDILPPDLVGFTTESGRPLVRQSDVKADINSYGRCTGEAVLTLKVKYSVKRATIFKTHIYLKYYAPEPERMAGYYYSSFDSSISAFTLRELRQHHDELVWVTGCP